MRHLVIGIGELVHLDDGSTGLISGNKMHDEEKLISKNMSILIENGIISKIKEEEDLINGTLYRATRCLPLRSVISGSPCQTA